MFAFREVSVCMRLFVQLLCHLLRVLRQWSAYDYYGNYIGWVYVAVFYPYNGNSFTSAPGFYLATPSHTISTTMGPPSMYSISTTSTIDMATKSLTLVRPNL